MRLALLAALLGTALAQDAPADSSSTLMSAASAQSTGPAPSSVASGPATAAASAATGAASGGPTPTPGDYQPAPGEGGLLSILGVLGQLQHGCRMAATQLLTGPAASCLHTPLILQAMQSNSSVVPHLTVYLEQTCGGPGCSNATITDIATTLMESCAADLADAGLSEPEIQMYAQMYPLAREAACLKTSEPGAFQEGGNATGNATAGGGQNSTSPSPPPSPSGLAPNATATAPTGAGQNASAPLESAYKRQDSATATPATTPAASASGMPGQAPPASNATAGVPAGNATTGAGGNTTAPLPATNSTNTTGNGTFCAVALVQALEAWQGKPVTAAQLVSYIYSADARATLSTFPATSLCTDCMYGAVTLVHASAPWLTQLTVDGGNTFDAWFNQTCPASATGVSSNGTMPEDITPAARNSTFGFPVSFFNETTGQMETKMPNATATPIGAGANGTAPGNESQTNGTGPSASASSWFYPPRPSASASGSPLAMSGAATPVTESIPAPEGTASGQPSQAGAQESAGPARRALRFARP